MKSFNGVGSVLAMVTLFLGLTITGCEKTSEDEGEGEEAAEMVEQTVEASQLPKFSISVPSAIADSQEDRAIEVAWESDELDVLVAEHPESNVDEETETKVRSGYCSTDTQELVELKQEGPRSHSICETSKWKKYTVTEEVDGKLLYCTATAKDGGDVEPLKAICDTFKIL